MMRIGTVILCRYNSSRLPGKILKEIEGKPVLSYIYDKFEKITSKDLLSVATSIESTDDIIEDFCIQQNYNCFRGDLHNVSKRFLDVALQNKYDYIIRINGDALFVDINIYKQMIEICKAGDYDFVSNVKGRTFPFGMSIEIIKTAFYQKIQKEIQKSTRYIEHVTLYLYENASVGKQYHFENEICKDLAGLDVALDEQKDFELSQRLMKELKDNYYNCDLLEFNKAIEKVKNEYKLEGKAWCFTHS